jgi:histidinol-phosphate aminotransferase
MLEPRATIAAMKAYVPGILVPGKIKLASNENPLGPSPLAIEAVREYIGSSQLYPDGSATKVREALAEHYNIPVVRLIVGNGSDEILILATSSFINPGEEVIIADHTFSEYAYSSKLFDARVKIVALDNGCFDLEAIRAAINAYTRMIFLCSPNNPTGTTIPKKTLETFLSSLSEDILVVLDQAYGEYATEPDFPDPVELVERFPRLLVVRTYSKIYGLAGLRVGYGLANETVVATMQKARSAFSVNALAQVAAVAALKDGDFVKQSRDLNRTGKNYLETELGKMGIAFYLTQANFICIETRRDAQAMYRAILEGGGTIRALTSFGLPSCIRLTISTR